MKNQINKNRYGYYFIIPFFVVFAIFQLYPMIYTITLSFTDLKGFSTESNFILFENYITLLNNELFFEAISNTFIIWGMNFIPQLGISLLLAVWFTRTKQKIKGAGAFKVIYYLPNIITAASVAILFSKLFNYSDGPIWIWLVDMGLIESDYNLYLKPWPSRMIVSFIQFWIWFGNTTIVIVAAMLGVNTDFYEAAEIDGANKFQLFKCITVPLIKPVLLYTLVTSCIGGLQIFDIPYLFLNGGPVGSTETIVTYIYKQAFTGTRNYGIASAASVILLFIAGVMSLGLFKSFKEKTTG